MAKTWNTNGFKIVRGSPERVDPRGLKIDYTKNRTGVKPTREEVADLMATIPVRGQDTPIWVRPLSLDDAADAMDVIAGFRRCAAYEYLNEERDEENKLLIAFIVKKVNAEEAAILNVKENEDRKQFTDVERAFTIRRFENAGKTDEEIATIFGKSPAWVFLRKKILTLSKRIQDLGQQGLIKANSLFRIADAPEDKRDEMVAAAQAEARAEIEANGGTVPDETVFVPITESHILKAAKKKGVKTTGGWKPKAIKEWCEAEDGPGNPAPVRKMLRAIKATVEGEMEPDKLLAILVRNSKAAAQKDED